MGETDFEGGEAEFAGARRSGAVEVHGGFASPVVEDFKLAPEDAAHTGAEGLGDRFFTGEPCGQLFGAAATVTLFALGVEALDESLAEAVKRSLDAGDFDGVDAGSEAAAGEANSQ